MARLSSLRRRRSPPVPQVSLDALMHALPEPVIVVERDSRIAYANFEAQQFFGTGAPGMIGHALEEFVPADSPVHGMIEQGLSQAISLSDYGVTLETPRIGRRFVIVTVAPLSDPPERVLVKFHELSMARRIDNQLTHRGAARSVTAMASMLAHEIKNPLSGIRGAAQLLEQQVGPEDQELTRLICDEADRIVALVDRMEVFSDERPLEREPINIHTVLETVRKVAQNGFARTSRFIERYDPSLPPVLGNRGQLTQVFLNLIKNAAEAIPDDQGEIVISTAYQRGVSIAVPGTAERLNLPIVISVQDNGGGIPEDLQHHLFDPFVTTKKNGSGLGLALVAKIIGDHGGVIGFESSPRRTLFTVSLPKAERAALAGA